MKLHTRSILQELNELAEIRNKDALFESRATNIINSAINLLETLKKHYTAEQADELERRLLNAIRGQDPPNSLAAYARSLNPKEPRDR